ncbi:MAG: M56 family metallopeptidase [Lachnospiraceae bacterium]|nr:M56 family metallopeptidase [Lachnospiraceae bacterium]
MAEQLLYSTCVLAGITVLSVILKGTKYARLKYALWLPAAVILLFPLQILEGYLGNIGDTIHTDAAGWQQGERVMAIIRGIGRVIFFLIFTIKNLRFYLYLKRNRIRKGVWKKRLIVYELRNLRSPCLFGIFAPAIYLNEINSQEKRRERLILNHEYTHYRHGDHIWSVVRCLCIILYWYHPLVWIAAAISRRDQELACDAGTLKRIGEKNRIPYKSMLVSMAQKTSDTVTDKLMPAGRRLTLLDTSTSVAGAPSFRK